MDIFDLLENRDEIGLKAFLLTKGQSRLLLRKDDLSPMRYAIRSEWKLGMTILSEFGDVDIRDSRSSETDLMFAVKLGKMEIIQHICQLAPHTIDFVSTDDRNKRYSALTEAIKMGREDIVKFLLETGKALQPRVRTYSKFESGKEIKHWTNPNSKIEAETFKEALMDRSILDLLLTARPHLLNGEFAYAINAVSRGLVDILPILLRHDPEMIHEVDTENKTVLFHAVELNSTAGVEFLLRAGSKHVNIPHEDRMPIEMAIRNRNFKIVQILIQFGADVSLVFCKLATLIGSIATWGSVPALNLLVEKLPRSEIQRAIDSSPFENPIRSAIKNARLEMIIALHSLGVSLNRVDMSDYRLENQFEVILVVTRLQFQHRLRLEQTWNRSFDDLSFKSNLDFASILDHPNFDGNSMFHVALLRNDLEWGMNLIQLGSQALDKPNRLNFSPLETAVNSRDRKQFAQFLLAIGANVKLVRAPLIDRLKSIRATLTEEMILRYRFQTYFRRSLIEQLLWWT